MLRGIKTKFGLCLIAPISLLVISFTGGCSTIGKESNTISYSEIENTVDSILAKQFENGDLPGAVVLVSHKDWVFKKAYGYSQKYEFGMKDLDKHKAMALDSVFDIASLTKVFGTTLAYMNLVQDGKVDLNNKLSNFFPESPAHKVISLYQILNHTSGLQAWRPIYLHANNEADAIKYILELPLQSEPGEKRVYSDLGFMLLGHLVTRLSGKNLSDYLESEVYPKFGLSELKFGPFKSPNVVATSHGNLFEQKMIDDDDFGFKCEETSAEFEAWRNYTLIGEVNDGNAHHAFEGMAGHAGLFSNAENLHLIFKSFRAGSGGPIQPEVLMQFFTPDKFGNGLGWGMSAEVLGFDEAPEGSIGHTGFTGTYVFANPNLAVEVILLTNRQNSGELPDGMYFDTKSLGVELTKAVLSSGL